MFQIVSNTPIFRRLFIAFALAAAIPALVIIVLSSNYISSLNTHGQATRTSFDAQSIASQQQTNLQTMNALLQAREAQIFASLSGSIPTPSMATSGASISNDILTREANFSQTLKSYQSNFQLATSSNMSSIRSILLSDAPNTGNQIINDQQATLSAVVNNLWPTYKNAQDQELSQLSKLQNILLAKKVLTPQQLNSSYVQASSTLSDANTRFANLSNAWQRVVDIAGTMGKTVSAIGPSVTQPVLISTTIAIVFTLLVVLLTGYLVNLTITRPLRLLASLTKRIARGDTSARANIPGRDEIHLVANSMNNMLDNIVRLIQEVQAQRDNLQAQVEKLVSEVSGVGEGDLRIQAEVTADALGVLADSFNYMVEELSSLIVRVKSVAHEVENSTSMTYDRMAQLVETADIQIRQIAEAAIEVEHMADSSRQVAERAQVLYNVAREARQTAQSGREAVQQTVEGMERIHENVQETASKVQTLGERSREINNIVEVISGIAHQTNRLALDAAIQAAMAGENGKGFGAVAADIRRLAERAKDQAGMIARIVRSVREDIGAVAVSMQDTERETSAGARLSQEAGTALESIFSVVERQAREIEIITGMSRQQLQSSSSVVQIMQGVSNSTQESSGSTREASQNMERLARLAEQLLASVEAFKLPENMNYYPPGTSVSVAPEGQQDNLMTISGAFRTVTASAQPSAIGTYGGAYRPLPAGPSKRNVVAAPHQGGNSNGVPRRSGQEQT